MDRFYFYEQKRTGAYWETEMDFGFPSRSYALAFVVLWQPEKMDYINKKGIYELNC